MVWHFHFRFGYTHSLVVFTKKTGTQRCLVAVGETALIMLITLLIYFVAYKAGAFKDRNKEAFEDDLHEWNKLKNISAELKNEDH